MVDQPDRGDADLIVDAQAFAGFLRRRSEASSCDGDVLQRANKTRPLAGTDSLPVANAGETNSIAYAEKRNPTTKTPPIPTPADD
ncbi:MAG: hypothetical protein AAF750_12630 [Planctomycetota bacterium]